MGGLKSAEIDPVECPEQGKSPHRRKLGAAGANIKLAFLHLHWLQLHKSAKPRSVVI